MSGTLEQFAEVLTGIGIRGVPGLLEQWAERSQQFRAATLAWDAWVQSDDGKYRRWIAKYGPGQFRIDGTVSEAELRFTWQDWGDRVLGEGTAEDLFLRARALVRQGGPFGGPEVPARSGPLVAEKLIQHATPTGEIRIETSLPGFITVSKVRPDGSFVFELVNQGDRPAEIIQTVKRAEPVTLAIAGARLRWCFADCRPILGYVHAPPYELLLCVCARDRVAVLGLSEGALAAAHFMKPASLAAFDAGQWIDGWPKMRPTPLRAAASGSDSETAAPPASKVEEPEPPRRAASSRKRTDPQEPRLQRERSLADLVRRHFAHVAAQLPVRVVGAATAIELWSAIEHGYRRDLAAVSGTRTEIFALLVGAGLLKTMPSEHTGREALKILAGLSPVVRQIHHRRWSLMFPELRQEKSELVRVIREREDAVG